MIDLRPLSYFLVACEHESLGAAAQTLGISTSTLSTSLKSLETHFGAPLFRKRGTGLLAGHLAHWLYGAAVPLLLLEAFARRRVAAPADRPAIRLHVEILLRSTFGRFREALGRAIAETASADHLVLVEPHWPLEIGAAFAEETTDTLDFDRHHRIVIDTVPRQTGSVSPGWTVLRHDPWMFVRRQFGPADETRAAVPSRQVLMLPALPPALINQVEGWANSAGISFKLLDASPRDWPHLLDDHPDMTLLLPAGAIGTRLGVSRIDVSPVDPPLETSIIAKGDGSPLAGRFLNRLKKAFDDHGPPPVFAPVLTSRRIHYFNLAHNLGRVAAAARAAGVAQPALSQQLQKLEESLGTALFDRRTFGLVGTKASARFALATDLLDRRLREVETNGKTAALAEVGRLSLGLLPSVGSHGHLFSRITDAVADLRNRYSAMSFAVHVAPDSRLQKWISEGNIGLAVVETAPPHMPRLPLGPSEPLVLVVDPRYDLVPSGPVTLASLANLSLALPTARFGLRQLLDAATREAGFMLHPQYEFDALPMVIRLLMREPVATVLPASTMRTEALSAHLETHLIVDPEISRRLFVIYSGDRSLTSVERELVKLLLKHVGPPG